MAASVCVLSTGFMIGGTGAVASASTGSTDSPTDAAGAGDANPASNSKHGPITTFADAVRVAVENSVQHTVQGVTGTLNTLAKPGQVPSHTSKSPKTTFGGSPTVYGSTAANLPAATEPASPQAPAAPPVAEPAADVLPPAPSTPPAPPVVTPDPLAAATGAIVPVSNAIAVVADNMIALPAVVGSLPTSVAPVTDVLTSIQNVLTSLGDAGTSLSDLPADLAGLLGVTASAPTATIGAATRLPGQFPATTAAAPAPVWFSMPQLSALLGIQEAPAVDTAPAPVAPASVATVGTVGGESSTLPTSTASGDDGKNDVLSTVEHVLGAVAATVSLTALAAMALPGILGLLSTCAAGIRVGYRQAKAASALPDAAIARFVASGPLGVVRSSSQVEVRSLTPRVVRPAARDAGRPRGLHVVGSMPTAQLLDEAV